MSIACRSSISIALIGAGLLAGASAHAVRVNADGHGQALIYPYYTARSTPSGNSYVTAIAVTNLSARPKALKVRFFEGRTGAGVLGFNLFLAGYDVWTAGVVAAGAGAGLFTSDHSCTVPAIGSSGAAPTLFGNAGYVGDLAGDTLDRTFEGYFEVLEMGTIDPLSALGIAVTQTSDCMSPNASKPSCAGLPLTDAVPAGLSRPTGGLAGNASYFNVNEGTDFSVDATALSQWSDKVQWSAAGNAHPNLADVSPLVSYLVEAREDGDLAYVSNWSSGRDAVSAVLMVDSVHNDYTVEPAIKAATDWVMTMPTKRFYVDAVRSEPPFGTLRAFGAPASKWWCQVRSLGRCGGGDTSWDREGQTPGACIDYAVGLLETQSCGAASVESFGRNGSGGATSLVFNSTATDFVGLNAIWINGWYDLPATSFSGTLYSATEVSRLTGVAAGTTVINTLTGQATTGVTVTYHGLPIVGFAAQSYSTTGLPGISPNVLSNYGGVFAHKVTRRVEVRQ